MNDIFFFVGIVILSIIIIAVPLILWAEKSKKAKHMRRAYTEIYIGMPIKELIEIIGSPDSVGRRADGIDILTWNNDEKMFQPLWKRETTRAIVVEVKDQIIISYNGQNINNRTW